MTEHTLIYNVVGYDAGDAWLAYLPVKWQARTVAKALLKGVWKDFDPTTQPLYVRIKSRTFVIVDRKGRVKEAPPIAIPNELR